MTKASRTLRAIPAAVLYEAFEPASTSQYGEAAVGVAKALVRKSGPQRYWAEAVRKRASTPALGGCASE